MNPPKKVINSIQDGQSFLTHFHLAPDPDSIGSVMALKLGLESIGKTVQVISEDPVPQIAAFLPQIDTVEQLPLLDAVSTYKFDAYISLDSARWRLITHRDPPPLISQPFINIDHHVDNSLPDKLSWINPDASSASEMVHTLLKKLKIDITPDIATCLLFGLLGDTGVFQNSNTTNEVLELAIELRELGANYAQCIIELTRSHDLDQLKSWGILLENLKRSPDSSFVWSTISFSESENLASLPKLKFFANYIIRRVRGTDFGAILVEKTPNITKGSIRSRRPGVDVAQVARLLGGGGHKAAAGFMIEKPLKQAEQDFLNAIEYLKGKKKL